MPGARLDPDEYRWIHAFDDSSPFYTVDQDELLDDDLNVVHTVTLDEIVETWENA